MSHNLKGSSPKYTGPATDRPVLYSLITNIRAAVLTLSARGPCSVSSPPGIIPQWGSLSSVRIRVQVCTFNLGRSIENHDGKALSGTPERIRNLGCPSDSACPQDKFEFRFAKLTELLTTRSKSKAGAGPSCKSCPSFALPLRGFEPPTYGLGNRCSILTELQGRLELFKHQVQLFGRCLLGFLLAPSAPAPTMTSHGDRHRKLRAVRLAVRLADCIGRPA